MDLYADLIAVAIVSLLAAISPGPDFFIVMKNSLTYSRRQGLLTVCGVCAALIVHLTYSLVGIGLLLAESPFTYSLIKLIGALYLIYIGATGLISSFKKRIEEVSAIQKSTTLLSDKAAFMQGFLTNLLNPKCALFFISLFSQFVSPATPPLLKVVFAAVNWSLSFGWFVFLAYIVTGQKLQKRLARVRVHLDRAMGSVLIVLGLKLLFVPM